MHAESDSRGYSRLVAFFLLTGALLAGLAGCHRAPGPNVVATVNGKPINRADLDKMYQASLKGNQQKPSSQEADIQRLNVLHQ
ncbi:MAG: SurA N-terminal domain-containing protein, partial [Terracidiphilus sp.]